MVVLGGDEGSFKGRLWTYLDPLGRQVVFEATATHERAGPEAFLSSFRGYLQADAYKGYDALYSSGRIVEVACWAHGRRRFKESLDTEPRAAEVLLLVQQLYAIEDEAKDLSTEVRRALRQERSVPVLAKIDEVRRRLQADVLPKSPLGDALRYLDNQWAPLQRFVEDGRLAIDNNRAENQLRSRRGGSEELALRGQSRRRPLGRGSLLARPELSPRRRRPLRLLPRRAASAADAPAAS